MQREVNTDEKGNIREVSTDQQNSIEVSFNAKGEMSFKVKCYHDDPAEMEKTLRAYIAIARGMKE